jgi:hypothetical protein
MMVAIDLVVWTLSLQIHILSLPRDQVRGRRGGRDASNGQSIHPTESFSGLRRFPARFPLRMLFARISSASFCLLEISLSEGE